MANAYTIISVQTPPSTDPDPAVVITGTVNGVQVSFRTWQSVYTSHAGTAVGFQAWASPLLLAAYNAQLPPTPSTPPINSWSQ